MIGSNRYLTRSSAIEVAAANESCTLLESFFTNRPYATAPNATGGTTESYSIHPCHSIARLIQPHSAMIDRATRTMTNVSDGVR